MQRKWSLAFVGFALLLSLVLAKPSTYKCRCAFKVGTSQDAKQSALNYVCGNMNCAPIQPGGASFFPDTVASHASWAINQWYLGHPENPSVSCNFGNSAEMLCADCNCVFNAQNVTVEQMKDAMAFVCGNLDCSPIYSGGSNFQPDTVEAHSAWAINAWYQSHDWAVESCDFNKVAHLEPTVCGNR